VGLVELEEENIAEDWTLEEKLRELCEGLEMLDKVGLLALMLVSSQVS
jgi:hypothetical protein